MIVRKNQVVSSIFILTDGMLKIVAPEQERKKSIKPTHKLSLLSHEDTAAFEYLSLSNDSKKGMALKVQQLYTTQAYITVGLCNRMK